MPSQYRFWSKSLNIHFGYFSWGDNPFSLEQMLRQMNGKVASSLASNGLPPRHIIDLGCGYGATILQLLSHFPKAKITGINIDEAQIQYAQAAILQAGFSERAKVINANFQDTGLPEASFDAAYALETSCYGHGENKTAFIAEAARLLNSDGKLVVVDGFQKHDRKMPSLVSWCYRKCTAAWEIPSLANIQSFKLELQHHGFGNIEAKDVSWHGFPSILHIPLVVVKLLVSHIFHADKSKLGYAKALLLTFFMAPFKNHFGYYLVTCSKSTVELKK